jgi:hypothetical protein
VIIALYPDYFPKYHQSFGKYNGHTVFSVRKEMGYCTVYYLTELHLEKQKDTDIPCTILLGSYVFSTRDVALTKAHVWLCGGRGVNKCCTGAGAVTPVVYWQQGHSSRVGLRRGARGNPSLGE